MAQKKPKRGHVLPYGEGSFSYSESRKLWIGTLEAGWTDKGKRRRVYVTARDEDVAWDKLTAKRKTLLTEGRAATAQKSLTVAAWVAKWLEVQETTLRPGSYRGAASYMRKWVIPTVGRVQLEDLTAEDVRKVARAVLKAGKSSTTAGTIQGVFQKCLRDALTEGYTVPRPPLEAKKPSKDYSHARSEIPFEDAVRLVGVAREQPDGSGWVAALLNGLRQGERLGLTWDRVDFEAGTLDISWQLQPLPYVRPRDRSSGFRVPNGYEARQLVNSYHLVRPKSRAGTRVIPMVPWLAQSLQEWREKGPQNEHSLVWPRNETMPRAADDDLAAWKALQDAAQVWKVPGEPPTYFVLHEARHTTATLLLAAKVDPEIIRAIMGHSKVITTQGYQHVSLAMMREAVDRGADLLGIGA